MITRTAEPLARALLAAVAMAPAACASAPRPPPPGPIATTITVAVADTGWHTDICVRRDDAGAWLLSLPRDPAAARVLCFGFGDRRYMVERDHSLFATLLSGLPSAGAIVMTPLPGGPAAFFGAENVTEIGISRSGAAGLAAFLRASIEADASGAAVALGEAPVPGRRFFAATDHYSGLNTCNTWTGAALQSAGVPVRDGALFASDVVDQVKALAATRARAAPAGPGAAAPAPAGSP